MPPIRFVAAAVLTGIVVVVVVGKVAGAEEDHSRGWNSNIGWVKNFLEARSRARGLDKPIMLLMHREW